MLTKAAQYLGAQHSGGGAQLPVLVAWEQRHPRRIADPARGCGSSAVASDPDRVGSLQFIAAERATVLRWGQTGQLSILAAFA